ncbi:MAG: protein kinase [Bryobacteraceae bacterium]|nr:protein kinase [Bryobacteraceae bacterium]
MHLALGDTVGPYEITSRLGAGGMGEVYRARDTKLGRDVALKVVAPSLLQDAEYLARFQREAQVLASLNHPNIAQIYGVEQQAIVMELVEGATLAGPVPVEEAIALGKQLAGALEAAHEKGIVHRDIKPGNVKVTKDGTVKVLDFGLAKDGSRESAVPADSPTITIASTRAGVVLGTAAYMAPEQARGHQVDGRADIWAFGAVMYELLTGRPAFGGESVADILAATMKQEPDWSALPPDTPASVAALLRRCLTKDRRQRLQAMGEARIALERPVEGAAPAKTGSRLRLGVLLVGLAMVAAGFGAVAGWLAHRPAGKLVTRWLVQPGREFDSIRTARMGAAAILSPDGKRLVYTGRGADGQWMLYTRLVEEEQASPIPGTEAALNPIFDPAGETLAFFANGKLRRVSVRGEGLTTLCNAPSSQGASWSPDGSLVAALSSSGVLSRIPPGGGTSSPVTKLEDGELTHRWPQVLPGGETVLFTAHTAGLSFDDANIVAQSLRSGQRKTLVKGGTFGRYAPSGYLLYVKNQTLFAVRMDAGSLTVTGEAMPVVAGVSTSEYGDAQYDVTAEGSLLYSKAVPTRRRLAWLSAGGGLSPLRAERGPYGVFLDLSSDGSRLAFVTTEAGNRDVWTYDIRSERVARLTASEGFDGFPHWSPTGKHILFSSVRHSGAQNLYWMRADGGGEAVRLMESTAVQIPGVVTPDGSRLLFTEVGQDTGYDLVSVPLEGADGDRPRAGKREYFLKTPFNEATPSISPDGRWVAYDSNETGRTEVFVRAVANGTGKWMVSSGGGSNASWSKSGRRLYFLTSQGIQVADYTVTGEEFVPGKPRLWAGHPGLRGFAIHPDGTRAAIAEEDEAVPEDARTLVLVTGLLEDLRRR